jgi:hypothetical protein
MQCGDLRARLLAGDGIEDAAAAAHLAACADCRSFVQQTERLDALLRPALVVEPPAALQASLAALVQTVAVPEAPAVAATPVANRSFWPDWLWWPRTAMGVAQVLALVTTALASWQVFSWISGLSPVLGDIPYALGLLLESPTIRQLTELPIDIQSLAMWSIVALAGWALSESGPIGRARQSV